MTSFFYTYIAAWVTACVIAIVLMVQNHNTIILFQKDYWNFLKIKWKLTTFLIATSAFIILAPYTGDPTWDYYDAAFMSILTFMTAPWSVGTLFRFITKQEKLKIAYIAVCVWMFSASWSYDIYLVFRDGEYPNTWLPNIFASGVLYVSAGLFWNLEYREGRGVIFGFMESDWPKTDGSESFNKILFYALPFMILAAAIFVPFFI
jgi:Zn-dependent protease with chaperone function